MGDEKESSPFCLSTSAMFHEGLIIIDHHNHSVQSTTLPIYITCRHRNFLDITNHLLTDRFALPTFPALSAGKFNLLTLNSTEDLIKSPITTSQKQAMGYIVRKYLYFIAETRNNSSRQTYASKHEFTRAAYCQVEWSSHNIRRAGSVEWQPSVCRLAWPVCL